VQWSVASGQWSVFRRGGVGRPVLLWMSELLWITALLVAGVFEEGYERLETFE
jgi:hypothetical protein